MFPLSKGTGATTIFPCNPTVGLDPVLASDWSAENHHLHATAQVRSHRGVQSHSNGQKWTFHIGHAKLIPKDSIFFRLPRAVEAVGRWDEAELKAFFMSLSASAV